MVVRIYKQRWYYDIISVVVSDIVTIVESRYYINGRVKIKQKW